MSGRARGLAQLAIERPGRVLALCALATLALAPLDLRLELDTDPVHLLPPDPAAQAFARYAGHFAGDRLLLVLIEGGEPEARERFADDYARTLALLPEVESVDARLKPAAGEFLKHHLVSLLTADEIASLAARLTPEALAAQAHRLRSLLAAPGGSALAPVLTADPLELIPMLAARLEAGFTALARTGRYQSADGQALLLYVRPRAPASDLAADRRLLASATRAAVALGATPGTLPGSPELRVGFAGACAYAPAWRDWLERDGSLATTLSGAAVLLLFGLVFRSLRVLPLVAVPLAAGVLWTGAAAGALFGRVDAVSLTFGTVLLSIGIDFPIQIYNRLREELATRPPREALSATFAALAGPSLLATLGPALVFSTCALSAIHGLAELGLLAALGLFANLLAMFTVFPALLALMPARFWTRAAAAPVTSGPLAWLGNVAARRARALLLACGALFVLSLPLAARVRVEPRLTMLRPPDMPPVEVDRELARRFGDRERTLVALVEDANPERALERADAWRAQIERLRQSGLVRGYVSLASLVPSRAAQAERAARLSRVTPGAAARLTAALSEAGLDPKAFASFVAALERPPPPITVAGARAAGLELLLTPVLSEGAPSRGSAPGTARRVATLVFPAEGHESAARAALIDFARTDGGIVTGLPVLEDALHDTVRHDALAIALAAASCVALLLLVWYRRPRPFLAVFAPLVLAWAGFAATLAAAGLSLSVFNLLAVPLVIGYGIDDHVFLVARHQSDASCGPARALATAGRAVALTSLSTMAGFGALGAARLAGLRSFGLAGALAVAWCLVAALAVLPALLALLWPSRR